MKYTIPTLALTLIVAAPVFAKQQMPDQGEMFMKTFDANGDGRVSKDEYMKPQIQHIEKQFDYLDKNKDGVVNADEAEAFAKEMQQRMEQMQRQMGERKGSKGSKDR
jgi:Ca2+-binding EF-hand superfamily protein